MYIKDEELKYLKLLSKSFPTIAETSTEIINLEAILTLPKGTEHYISDIHGEYEAFNHVLKNCSGVIKEKINILFNELSDSKKNEFATIIYYPRERIEHIQSLEIDMNSWYKQIIIKILEILKLVSSKYTRSKVVKAMSKEFSYIIQELLYERTEDKNKKEYIEGIIRTIIDIDRSKEFIVEVSELIQKFIMDTLHIVGDIYDRGPYPHKIMDRLLNYHNVDIQWGNHDILWIGAACGHRACISNAIRICLRYSSTEILEDGYGINLLPLATLALKYYEDDMCVGFKPKTEGKIKDIALMTKMHKAITIIQFKLEGQVIKRNKSFKMEDRLLLEQLITTHKIIDKDNPYQLNKDENEVVEQLVRSFKNSEKLQEHTRFILEKGGVYLKRNGNLLFHGCVPLDENGEFRKVDIFGERYSGKKLFEKCDQICREGYYNVKNIKAKDFIWYLWCGKNSPLFGKDKMKTFERYFFTDKNTHIENYDYYYKFSDDKNVMNRILSEFNLDFKHAHIINGHVPVKVKNGESAIRGAGKLLVIDGGFSKSYQATTGIAGYTLIFNSHGKRLVSHRAFKNQKEAVEKCFDIQSTAKIIDSREIRLRVRDTDKGKELENQIEELKKLLYCYKRGLINVSI